MNLGLYGAAIYREILIDQHSKRSHPNQAVDVVVCQTFRKAFGSRVLNSCLLPDPVFLNKALEIVVSLSVSSPSPVWLGCRGDRRRAGMQQRLVHFSTNPQPVQ
jgi:hypothetical protein